MVALEMKIVEVVVGEVMRRRRNFTHRIKTGWCYCLNNNNKTLNWITLYFVSNYVYLSLVFNLKTNLSWN